MTTDDRASTEFETDAPLAPRFRCSPASSRRTCNGSRWCADGARLSGRTSALVREGDVGDELVVIVEGLGPRRPWRPPTADRTVHPDAIESGDHIGELAVLRDAPARRDGHRRRRWGPHGLVLGGDGLRAILRERPDAAMAMLATLAERISHASRVGTWSTPTPAGATLPTGTVTFLRTDVEGSMRLARELGPAWDAVNACAHGHHPARRSTSTAASACAPRATLLFAVVPGGAQPRVSRGDRRAAGARRATTGRTAPIVRVRMGLHSGEAYLAGDDYGGFEVNRAARIAAAGHGGQIVLSETDPSARRRRAARRRRRPRPRARHALRDVPRARASVPARRSGPADRSSPPLRSRDRDGRRPAVATDELHRARRRSSTSCRDLLD